MHRRSFVGKYEVKIMFRSLELESRRKAVVDLTHIDLSYLHLVARKELGGVANHALSHVVFEKEVERFERAARSRVSADGPN